MSAFYDIWIGAGDQQPPSYKRSINSNWEQADSNTWLSLPGNELFVKRISDGQFDLILLGQLYEEIKDAALLKRCTDYITRKSNNYKDPAGHYIIFVRNRDDDSTSVFTNRFGTYHAYWLDEQSCNAISTCYLALAKSRPKKVLDWQGLTGFMAMGYFPGDTTYLQGIKILEPASFYNFDNSLRLTDKKRYWNWQYEPVQRETIEYIHLLNDVLQGSLSVAVKSRKVALPLSGGLDSRQLAGVLTSGMPYHNLKAFSYGYSSNSPETNIARQIAANLDIDIHTYTLPNYLFEKLDIIGESVEFFQYLDGTRQASATGWLAQNTDVVAGGHWGDVWMDSITVEGEHGLSDAFHKKIIKRGSNWLLEHLCEQHLNDGRMYLDDYFQSFINRYRYIGDASFRMKIYKTEQWSFRWTLASIRMYQPGAFPVLPFYDNRITDLLSAIPQNVLQGRKLQVEFIKHYYPVLAKIKWQEYNADLYNYPWLNNRNIMYRAAAKIKRHLTSEKVVQRNWEVFFMDEQGRKNLYSALLDNSYLHNYIDKRKVEDLLSEFYKDPSAANGYTVSMLLTFAAFLEKLPG